MRKLIRDALLTGSLLLAALPSSYAQTIPAPITVNFGFGGFIDGNTGVFNPNRWITGSFSGIDWNGDQVLELNELTDFSCAGLNYSQRFGYEGSCQPQGLFCSVQSFTYAIGSTPSFSTMYEWWDGTTERDFSTVTGDRIQLVVNKGASPGFIDIWTSQTQFASPVPEPGRVRLLLAGLLALSLAAAAQRKAAARCRSTADVKALKDPVRK